MAIGESAGAEGEEGGEEGGGGREGGGATTKSAKQSSDAAGGASKSGSDTGAQAEDESNKAPDVAGPAYMPVILGTACHVLETPEEAGPEGHAVAETTANKASPVAAAGKHLPPDKPLPPTPGGKHAPPNKALPRTPFKKGSRSQHGARREGGFKADSPDDIAAERHKISEASDGGDIEGARNHLRPAVQKVSGFYHGGKTMKHQHSDDNRLEIGRQRTRQDEHVPEAPASGHYLGHQRNRAAAMKELMGRLDVTSKNEKSFWSGIHNKWSKFVPPDKAYMEGTTGGRVANDWEDMNGKWGDASKPGMLPWAHGGRDFWGAISTEYAKGASGDVHVYQNGQRYRAGGGPIWRSRELPVLLGGNKVNKITFHNVDNPGETTEVDPKTISHNQFKGSPFQPSMYKSGSGGGGS